MRILLSSDYGHASYKLFTQAKKELFSSAGESIFFLEFLGANSSSDELHYKVYWARYPISSELIEEYTVNIVTNKITPIFPSIIEINNVLISPIKQVRIPGTNKSISLPISFSIRFSEKGMSFNQPDIRDTAFVCAQQHENGYCQAYKAYLGDKLEQLGDIGELISVSVRTVDWQGTPHEWALDNVGWQGKTLRETMVEYPNYSIPETVTIGNNDFYKIGEGCCGDRSYSYITKGFDDNGSPLLIIFQATNSESKEIDAKKNTRKIPYLERLLQTVN